MALVWWALPLQAQTPDATPSGSGASESAEGIRGTASGEQEDWDPPLVPASDPFTLSSYDVIDAVWLIRRSEYLLWWDYESRPQTVTIASVQSFWTGYDPDAYEGHQNRYSILLNGKPIDWDHLYVEYDGDMLNLRLLYTYRNQKPPPDLPYRLRWP